MKTDRQDISNCSMAVVAERLVAAAVVPEEQNKPMYLYSPSERH